MIASTPDYRSSAVAPFPAYRTLLTRHIPFRPIEGTDAKPGNCI